LKRGDGNEGLFEHLMQYIVAGFDGDIFFSWQSSQNFLRQEGVFLGIDGSTFPV